MRPVYFRIARRSLAAGCPSSKTPALARHSRWSTQLLQLISLPLSRIIGRDGHSWDWCLTVTGSGRPRSNSSSRSLNGLFVRIGDRMAELPLTVFPILHWRRNHSLEHRHELPLCGSYNCARNFGLFPENFPVFLLNCLHAVQLRLARCSVASREKFPERDV